MRFLHAADLHLDSPLRSQALRNSDLADRLRAASRTVLAAMVDAAIAQRVDALLLAGDIFDSGVADVTSRAALATQLARLSRAGIRTILIRGNHDALLDHDRYGPIGDGVELLDRDRPTVQVGGASVHGLSFSARHAKDSMLPDYPRPEPGRINVGLMHTSLGGAPGHDPYAPCAEADLLAHGYDYWALGHIHKRFERRGEGRLAVMPGIPQGRSIREPGRGSATLVRIDADGVRADEIPLALLAFAERPVDLAGCTTQADASDRLAAAARAAARDDCAVALRLRLANAGRFAGDPGFAAALAEAAAEAVADVHIEAVRFDATPGTAALPQGAVADLAAMMAEDAATPGFRDEAARLLAEWRGALPRDIADVLAPEALDDLLDAGLTSVTGRLANRAEPE